MVLNGSPPRGGSSATCKKLSGGDDLCVVIDLAALRPFVQMGVAAGRGKVEPRYHRYFDIPLAIRSAELRFNLSQSATSSALVRADDEAAGAQIERLVAEGIDDFHAHMRSQVESSPQYKRMISSSDPVEQAMGRYMRRMVEAPPVKPALQRDSDTLTLFSADATKAGAEQQMLISVAVVGSLVALLLPAVQAAREAARRAQSSNNIKQLMLGILNYEASYRSMPPRAICAADGTPLLSWRVALLPFLEQQALYERFHLDEPWDSPHNKALIPLMPAVFADPSSVGTKEAGRSSYAAVVGEDGFMAINPPIVNEKVQGRRIAQIMDGMSRSLALIEVGPSAAPIWTQPEDWSPDPDDPAAGLGGNHPGGFLVGFADGSVRFLNSGIDPKTLRAMLTINAGELMEVP